MLDVVERIHFIVQILVHQIYHNKKPVLVPAAVVVVLRLLVTVAILLVTEVIVRGREAVLIHITVV